MTNSSEKADLAARREEMVDRQIAARGITDEAVLEAMREVPREAFVPEDMREFAYLDTPLPIGEEQTISQPYVVARMVEALALSAEDRVLDVGTGSGYAAAVMSRIAAAVYTVERHAALAKAARARFERLGYDNVHVRVGDGTRGWAEEAPFDAIAVAAAGPEVPRALKDQLASGGRLVMPAGPEPRLQRLIRLERTDGRFEQEDLGGVRFVPLIGEEGWDGTSAEEAVSGKEALAPAEAPATLPDQIARAAEPIPSIAEADLGALLDRIGDARVVLLGEATHGTSEFYRMRAQITQALVREKGFRIVAAEADWPDAARVDAYVRGAPVTNADHEPFRRFPTWMWANAEFSSFVEWMRRRNEDAGTAEGAVSFHGLDLYSLRISIASVLAYLDDVDPEAARVARERYGCLSLYEQDPATYGRAALTGRYRECEPEVVAMLKDLMDKRMDYARQDGQRFLDAVQNARLVANAERYYRAMYYGSAASWNLRDEHMFDTLQDLLDFRGAEARAVVWAHNSHLGDASATEMGATRGSTTSGSSAAKRSARQLTLSASGRTTAPLPPPPRGAGQWRSKRCARRTRRATSASCTKPAPRDQTPSCCRCARPARRCARRLWRNA